MPAFGVEFRQEVETTQGAPKADVVRPFPSWASTLAVAVFFAAQLGCEDSGTDPVLKVENVTAWKIPAMGPRLPGPRSVAVAPNDEVVLLDNGGRVLVYSSGGELRRQWEMPEHDIGRPEGVVVLEDGRIVVCDTHYYRVVVFHPDGSVERMFGSYGNEEGQFVYPVAITADADGNLYVGEYGGNDRIQVFRPDGTFVRQFGSFGTEPGQFQRPSGIAWHDGKVIVADAVNNRIQKFSDQGDLLGIISSLALGLNFPYDLGLATNGTFFVIEYGAGRITHMDQSGTVLGRFGTTGRGPEQFVTPWGIGVDSQNRLRIADTGNRRVIAMDAIISTGGGD